MLEQVGPGWTTVVYNGIKAKSKQKARTQSPKQNKTIDQPHRYEEACPHPLTLSALAVSRANTSTRAWPAW